MIPQPKPSPNTLTLVRIRSLQRQINKQLEANPQLRTYKSQSTVNNRLKSLAGSPTVVNTIMIVSRPAGTEPEPMEATVVVKLNLSVYLRGFGP